MPIQVYPQKRTPATKLLDILFPRHCVFCGHTVMPDQIMCEGCMQDPALSPGNYVRRFRLNPRADEVRRELTCCAPFLYENMQQSMTRFKFENRRIYVETYARAMAMLLKHRQTPVPDMITYVPATKNRRREYGYDQAQLLAKSLGRFTALPTESLLKRVRDCAIQHELPREKRLENVQDVFSVIQEQRVKKKTILLIDDIMTTGATVCECARTLYRFGAENVLVCTVCNVSAPDGNG